MEKEANKNTTYATSDLGIIAYIVMHMQTNPLLGIRYERIDGDLHGKKILHFSPENVCEQLSRDYFSSPFYDYRQAIDKSKAMVHASQKTPLS
tara:strand:- start:92 stop:370 length:279 start_codon:yes stop_codon:yes gene_type:complete